MKRLLAIAWGVVGAAGLAQAGVPVAPFASSQHPVIAAPTSAVLYDQMDAPTPSAGFTSQDFDTDNDGYDDQVAEDFLVPPGQTWNVDTVDVVGYFSNGGLPPTAFNVYFYQSVPASTFDNQQTFATGPSPFAVVSADFNGDGIGDVATANALDNTVSVLLNTTAPGAITPDFSAEQAFTVGALPFWLIAADLDGDGRPDIITANVNDNSVSVLLNTTAVGAADVSFAEHQDFLAGAAPFAVVATDVNGDGKLDLVVANRDAGTLSVLINTTASGDPTVSFAPQQVFAAGSTPNSIAAADINGDGKPDLVIANRDSNAASVLLNTTPDGAAVATFAALQSFPAGATPYSIAAPDVNGDGKPDMIIANWDDGTASVLLNTTATGDVVASFAPQQVFDSGASPFSISSSDINGDGRPDLLIANTGDGLASVLLDTTPAGAAVASFAPRQVFAAGDGPHAIVAFEVNGDGSPDLAVVNNSDASISVLLNSSAADTAQPGALLASASSQSYSGGATSGASASIALATPVNLAAGSYWLSVQAQLDQSGGQWYWGDRSVQSINLPFWQNPGDRFHSGCVAWTLKQNCGFPPDTAPAQLFRLSGSGEGIPPALQKSFDPAAVAVDASSTLTLTLGNANSAAATLSADLVDTFPAGLSIAANPNASTSCGGTLVATAGAGSVTLVASGSMIPANGACTVTVDVVAATAGSYVNTISAGALQTDAGDNTGPASATLIATGSGVNDPRIEVTPTPLAFALAAGASDMQDLTVSNNGGGVLTYQIAEAAALPKTSFFTARLAAASKGDTQIDSNDVLAPNPRAGARSRAQSIVLGDFSISQMTDNTPGEEGISCGQTGVTTANNSWWRRFVFSEYPTVGARANIASVTISSATAGPDGLPLTINLYSIPHSTTADTIPTSALTLIGSGSGSIDSGLVTATIPVSGIIADTAGQDLVVEWHTDGTADGQFFPGANASPETHPTFISAPTCGIADPTPVASLNFPNFHLVMVVNLTTAQSGGCQEPTDVSWLDVAPTSGSLAPGASAASMVTVDAATLPAGSYAATLCVTSNDPVTPLVSVPISLIVAPAPIDPCSASDMIFCDGFEDSAPTQAVRDAGFDAMRMPTNTDQAWHGSDSNDAAGTAPIWPPVSDALLAGNAAAWGGGWHTGNGGMQSWSQDVTIASGAPRYLHYRRFIAALPTEGKLTISVDGNVLSTTDIVQNGIDARWNNATVDVSAYADNAVHRIAFDYTTIGEDGNCFVDDITIDGAQASGRVPAHD